MNLNNEAVLYEVPSNPKDKYTEGLLSLCNFLDVEIARPILERVESNIDVSLEIDERFSILTYPIIYQTYEALFGIQNITVGGIITHNRPKQIQLGCKIISESAFIAQLKEKVNVEKLSDITLASLLTHIDWDDIKGISKFRLSGTRDINLTDYIKGLRRKNGRPVGEVTPLNKIDILSQETFYPKIIQEAWDSVRILDSIEDDLKKEVDDEVLTNWVNERVPDAGKSTYEALDIVYELMVGELLQGKNFKNIVQSDSSFQEVLEGMILLLTSKDFAFLEIGQSPQDVLSFK